MKVLIATSNIGKIDIYSGLFNKLGIESISLRDINLDINVEENGKDELENAILKAKAYHKLTNLPVLANDSGLIIDKFKIEEQPGQFVRRCNGKELSDEELLNSYVTRLNSVGGESFGQFNIAIAIIDCDGKLHTKMLYPKLYFISKPSPIMKKGFPLNSIIFDLKSRKYLSEMTEKERNEFEIEATQKQEEFIKQIFKC